MTISRSYARGVERALALFGWRPYRCLTCHHRFYDRPVQGAALTPADRLRDPTPPPQA